MRERLKSIPEFILAVVHHWWAVGMTVVAAIGLGVELRSSTSVSEFKIAIWVWLAIIGISLLIACFLAFDDVRKERDALRKQISKLHEANKPRFSFSRPSRTPIEDKRWGYIVQIEIKNVNGPGIQNCQVNLVSLTERDGADVYKFLPVAICTKRSTGRANWISSQFNLPWGHSKQLYFALTPREQTKYKPKILTELGPKELPGPGKYIARLQAVGDNAPPAYYTVKLDCKTDGQLDVTEVNTDDGAPYRQARGSSR